MSKSTSVLAVALVCGLAGCATTETSTVVQTTTAAVAQKPFTGTRVPVAIGAFANKSSYARGIFSDGVDRLGGQATTILLTHLQQSNRFNVLDRANLEQMKRESEFRGVGTAIKGANYVISGDITEFGRKEVGDKQLFGIAGRGKTQVAYAKVSILVINTVTSETVYSVQGAAEYALSEREVLGFGSTASYDSTLNGKVLNLAITEAVQKLAESVDAGAWAKN